MSERHEVSIETIGNDQELSCPCGDRIVVHYFHEATLDHFARTHRIEGVSFRRLVARTH